MKNFISVDFGHTNTVISVWNNGYVQSLKFNEIGYNYLENQNKVLVPSIIGSSKENCVEVGKKVSSEFVPGIKRLLFEDPQQLRSICSNEKSIKEWASCFFQKLIPQQYKHIVITVPTKSLNTDENTDYFNKLEAYSGIIKKILSQSVQGAKIYTLEESIATFCGLQLQRIKNSPNQYVCIIDIGAFTTDLYFAQFISDQQLQSGKVPPLYKTSIMFAGRNFDQEIMERLDLSSMMAAEKKKIDISSRPYQASEIHKSKIKWIVNEFFANHLLPLKGEIMKYIKEGDRLSIFLTGGSSQIYGLEEVLWKEFQFEGVKITVRNDKPFLSCSHGALWWLKSILKGGAHYEERLQFDLSLRLLKKDYKSRRLHHVNYPIIPKNTSFGDSKSLKPIWLKSGWDNQNEFKIDICKKEVDQQYFYQTKYSLEGSLKDNEEIKVTPEVTDDGAIKFTIIGKDGQMLLEFCERFF